MTATSNARRPISLALPLVARNPRPISSAATSGPKPALTARTDSSGSTSSHVPAPAIDDNSMTLASVDASAAIDESVAAAVRRRALPHRAMHQRASSSRPRPSGSPAASNSRGGCSPVSTIAPAFTPRNRLPSTISVAADLSTADERSHRCRQAPEHSTHRLKPSRIQPLALDSHVPSTFWAALDTAAFGALKTRWRNWRAARERLVKRSMGGRASRRELQMRRLGRGRAAVSDCLANRVRGCVH